MMSRPLAQLCARSPQIVLGALTLIAAGLCAFAVGVPERLALVGTGFGGSASDEADIALAEGLGHEPEPAYLLLVSGADPLSVPANDIALTTLEGQIEGVAGVADVREIARSDDGRSALVAVHPDLGLDERSLAEIEEGMRGVDPGILQVLIGGGRVTAEGARNLLLDEAPALSLLTLPLLLLALTAALGVRLGAAVLLGAVLAAAAAAAVLGLIGAAADVLAIGAVAAALLAFIAGVESASALVFRYRDESATLGPGVESVEYSLATVMRGVAIGAFSAALIGGAMLAVPSDTARSIGAGVIVAGLVGPLLALLPVTAVLALRSEAEIGQALPLVSGAERVEGPRTYRALLTLARGRRRGALVLVPIVLVLAVALPLLDAEAVGLDAAELPADAPAAVAEAQIATSFGPGAAAPFRVEIEGEPAAPSVTIYRDQISRIDGVELVGQGIDAGGRAFFEVTAAARPRSLAAQAVVAEVAAVPAPAPRRIAGGAAELRDAGDGLGGDLPLVAAVALLGTAALWSLLFRSAFGPLLALASTVAPLVGLAAVHFVFADGRLAGALGYEPAGAPHLSTYVLVGAVLLALALVRGAATAAALREERVLGGGAAGSLARSSLLTLMPAAVATVAGVVVAGVWLAAPLLAAQEVALGISVGLLADLLVTRLLVAPGLARLSLGGES